MTFSPYSPISLVGQQPVDQGFIGWTGDPGGANTTLLLTAGVLSLSAIPIRTMRVVSSIWAYVQTAGATLTANENFAGIWDTSGNLLGQTADQSTVWTSTGLKQMALTTPAQVSSPFVWIGLLSNGTTQPTFGRFGGFNVVVDANLSASTYRAASNGTGLTALANINPASNTIGPLLWAALS